MKKGFTLAEVMIFFLVMGIIVATMLTITKPVQKMREKNVKYRFASSYDILNTALFDMVNKTDDDGKEIYNPFLALTADDISVNYYNTKFEKMCKELADYVNTKGEIRCADSNKINNDAIKFAKNEEYDFRDANLAPNFETQNGMKFYLTDIMTINSSGEEATGTSDFSSLSEYSSYVHSDCYTEFEATYPSVSFIHGSSPAALLVKHHSSDYQKYTKAEALQELYNSYQCFNDYCYSSGGTMSSSCTYCDENFSTHISVGSGTAGSGKGSGTSSDSFSFALAYVDLGVSNQNRPHTIKYDMHSDYPPDVYVFALLDTGEAIPLGIAEADISYFDVRVRYVEGTAIHYSKYYSLNEAKNVAWGWYQDKLEPTKFVEGNAYTYGDYIRKYLETKGTQLYKFYDEGRSVFKQSWGTSGILSNCKCSSGAICDDSYNTCSILENTIKFGEHISP